MAYIRWPAIERQQSPPWGQGKVLDAAGIGEREGDERRIPLQEVQHHGWGESDAAALSLLRARRHVPMLGLAQYPDDGNHSETTRVFGEW